MAFLSRQKPDNTMTALPDKTEMMILSMHTSTTVDTPNSLGHPHSDTMNHYSNLRYFTHLADFQAGNVGSIPITRISFVLAG